MMRRMVQIGLRRSRLSASWKAALKAGTPKLRDRRPVVQAVGVGEEPDTMADEPLQSARGLDHFARPIGSRVRGDLLVIPGMRADRHSGAIEGSHLSARQPARLAQDHGHDEERGDEVVAAQNRQRVGVLAG